MMLSKDAATEGKVQSETYLVQLPPESEPLGRTAHEIEPEAMPETTPKKDQDTNEGVFAPARRACDGSRQRDGCARARRRPDKRVSKDPGPHTPEDTVQVPTAP